MRTMTAVVVTGTNLRYHEHELGTFSQGVVIAHDRIIDIASGDTIARREMLSTLWRTVDNAVFSKIHVQAITTEEDS